MKKVHLSEWKKWNLKWQPEIVPVVEILTIVNEYKPIINS